MEDKLERSGLDWLAVRPVTLENGRATGRIVEVNRDGLAGGDQRMWSGLLDGIRPPDRSGSASR